MPDLHSVFWDKASITSNLLEIIGNDEGTYLRRRVPTKAYKPLLLQKIADLEASFVRYKKDRLRLGYEEPTVMPPDMLNKYYLLQAELTVLNEEVKELNKRLAEYKDLDDIEGNRNVLAYGLRGYGKCHGLKCGNPELVNILKEIDGQRCELTDEGLLIIDKRSPYSGMLVSDFRKLAKEWQIQRQKEEAERFKLLQEQYKEQGLPVPQEPPVKSPSKVPMSSLPKWPEWAINYLKNEPTTK